ncbi:MAG TPA: hypothetical protein VHB20_03830 [Verrucomicrobiae bacterium]|jgi:hypothetical protein|nr:hypothetical protein [Verrucomicrobiae bacterium]
MRFRRLLPFVAVAVLATPLARAADLFDITAKTTDGSGLTIVSGNHSVIDLTQQLINNTGSFSALSGHSYNASLSYGGVQNALLYEVTQGTQYTAHLTTPFDRGVIDRTFVANSQDALNTEIKNYLKTDGASDLAKFLADINKKSPAGVLDGNPHSVTALNAQQSFFQYAFEPTLTEDEDNSGQSSDSTSRSGFALNAEGGEFDSKGIKGETYSVSPMVPFKLSDRVRLEITVPLEYTRIEGASEFGAGLQFAVPILLVKHTKQQPWTWQLTPLTGVLASGSADLLAGGLMANGGLASYASYHWHKWEFAMGNAVLIYHGVKVSIGDYTFDPDVSQQIFKTGFKVGRQLGHHWYAELYAIDTEFAEAAFIPRYATVGGGVGYRGAKKKGFIMLGAYTDLAPGYSSAKLQFGTGWKF